VTLDPSACWHLSRPVVGHAFIESHSIYFSSGKDGEDAAKTEMQSDVPVLSLIS
jgi:hypothetical protein